MWHLNLGVAHMGDLELLAKLYYVFLFIYLQILVYIDSKLYYVNYCTLFLNSRRVGSSWLFDVYDDANKWNNNLLKLTLHVNLKKQFTLNVI